MKDYMSLQNGSDIRGIALDGDNGEKANLTSEAVFDITKSFVFWLSEKAEKPSKILKIGVGTDSRLSAGIMRQAILSGIEAGGANGFDCGMTSTPAMFMSTVFPESDFDGAIMATASHLPWNRNGMKFFTKGKGTESADVTAILTKAQETLPEVPSGTRTKFDLMPLYNSHLQTVIRNGIEDQSEFPLAGYKIAIDAGNGSAGFFATEVLEPLGADISGSQFLEPDGRFPNHVPNPELPEVMEAAKKMTLESHSDLGIVFDTDVDRAAFVDDKGTILSRNRLIGVLAEIVSKKYPGCTIVTDSVTSDHLTKFISKLGCIHHRFKRGYRNVINEAIRLNREGIICPLAIETSGHCAFSDNYFLDDGAYLAAVMIAETVKCRREGRSLADLASELKDPLESVEYRIKILNPDPQKYCESVLSDLREYTARQPSWKIAPENYEGVRISIPVFKGWFLLRMSLHEPLMPLMIESDLEGGVNSILNEIKPFLEMYPDLELPF